MVAFWIVALISGGVILSLLALYAGKSDEASALKVKVLELEEGLRISNDIRLQQREMIRELLKGARP